MNRFSKFFIFAALLVPVAISTKTAGFDIVRALTETENHDVFIGDTINVETRRLYHDGNSKDVRGLIINPNGDSFQGRSFTISEAGLYKVVYQAYFGHHKEEQVINYLCKRRSKDFFNITNPVDISYGDYRHNTSNYHHEGLLIDVKNGTEIKFNQALSVDDFLIDQTQYDPTKGYKDRTSTIEAKPIIDFLVDPSVYMKTDFTAMTIRLTDSVDASNYVDIRIEDGYYSSSYDSGSLSYVRVGASCNWQLGWEWETIEGKQNQGKYHNGISGTGLNLSYRGQPYNDQILSAQILFCSANGRFYTYRGSLETDFAYFINELSDPIVYGNSVWEGFKSGKFFLSIIPTAFSNATGRILVKSIGKYVLNSEILTDNIAPTINVDTKGYDTKNLPRAVVGKRYPVFPATVTDNYDSNLECEVTVTYRDLAKEKDIDVSVSDGSFLVSKSGFYTIRYDAKDRSGNVADSITLKVITVDSFTDVTLTLDLSPESKHAYDVIQIPGLEHVSVTGGIGDVIITRKVIDPKGSEITVTGDEFRATLVGDYQVVYTGTDYIGNTGTATHIIHSQALLSPKFITEPNLPPALISGFKYSFDNIKAIDTEDGEVVEVTPQIFVNGSPHDGSYTASGTKAIITYKAEETTKDYELDVIDVANSEGGFDHSKYFISSEFTFEESTYNDTPNVKVSSSGSGSCSFINKLNPDNFYIGMTLLGEESHIGIIRVKLIDSINQNISVTFEIDIANSKIHAPHLPEQVFSFSGQKIGLEYNDQTQGFADTNQNSLGSIIKDDNGDQFNGFNNGIYLQIETDEVSAASSFAIEKICNQPLGYRNKGKDRIQPTIRYNTQLISEQHKGAQFVYPTFEAFDVLSDISESTIQIRKPNGSNINGQKDMSQTFVIEEVGEYRITYTAKDSSGNQKKVVEIVSVYDDVKPTITINNPPKSSYNLNSAFEIPSYTASDESGKYTVDVILILPTNEMRLLTHYVHNEEEGIDVTEYALDPEKELYDTSFIVNNTTCRLQMSGTYRLRYVVYDAAYNTTIVEYSFTVK